jgi:hypothetical protein
MPHKSQQNMICHKNPSNLKNLIISPRDKLRFKKANKCIEIGILEESENQPNFFRYLTLFPS